jgi:microcystin-dependent protein
MKSRAQRLARILTLAAVTSAAASWSTVSYACTPEPYLSAVCVLAWGRNDLRGYLPAAGQTLSISQNTTLFALLGTTYGGNGVSTFNLPDLRGRTIIGAGTGLVGSYALGQLGGTPRTTLTQAHVPAHAHALAAVNLSGVTATLDLSKITNNTSSAALNNVHFNVDSSKLRIRAVNASASTATPTDAALSVSAGAANRMYSSSPPNVDLAAAALAGAITVATTDTAPVTLGGGATLALSGTLPAGNTGVTGQSTPLDTITPYLAMYYFIAVQGVFPSSN